MNRTLLFIIVWMIYSPMLFADVSTKEEQWKEMNRNSVTLFTGGKREDAIKMMKEAILFAEEHFSKESLNVAKSLNNLGNFYLQMNNIDQARNRYQEAIAIEKSIMGKNHSVVADSLFNLAVTHAIRNENDQAREILGETLAIYESQDKPDAEAIDRVKNILSQLG